MVSLQVRSLRSDIGLEIYQMVFWPVKKKICNIIE